LKNPQLYFANYLDADVLASTDSVAPTRDDGGLENPDVIGRYDLNVGMSLMPILFCKMGKSSANYKATVNSSTQVLCWLQGAASHSHVHLLLDGTTSYCWSLLRAKHLIY